jgi:hypothetical protein
MKKFYLPLLIICNHNFVAQPLTIDWKKIISYDKTTATGAITLDHLGQIFVEGFFNGGNNSPGGTFVNAYSPNGQLLWKDLTVTNSTSRTGGITCDKLGNVYTLCNLLFGGASIGNAFYSGNGSYLLKYSNTGQLKWVKHHDMNNWSGSLSIDSSNFIYTTFAGKYDTSGNSIYNFPRVGRLCLDGNSNIFTQELTLSPKILTKRTAAGPYSWTCQISDGGTIDADAQGNLYHFSIANNELTKRNSTGQLQWMVNTTEYGDLPIFAGIPGFLYTASVQQVGNVGFLSISKYNSATGSMLWKFLLPNDTVVGGFQPSGIYVRGANIYISATYISCLKSMVMKLTDSSMVSTTINDINPDCHAFKIGPNPSNGVFTLNIDQPPVHVDYCIYNATGKLVFSGHLSENFTEINLSTHPKGLYYLTLIRDGVRAEALKIIKE